jgi:hypothetical protein
MKLTSLQKVPAWMIALGLSAGLLGVATLATAQAPPSAYRPAAPQPGPGPVGPVGPGPVTMTGPGASASGMPAGGAPTQMQALLDAPGRVVMIDEYRIGETHVSGAVASAQEGPPAPPTRVRFSAAVAYERGREDQRVKGLKVTIERPTPSGDTDEVVCFVDRGEMQTLAAALSQMADQAGRRDRDRSDFRRRGRGGPEATRFTHYSTADFAVSVRFEPGRPVIYVRNPNRPDSRINLGDESTPGVLQQWNDWIDAAHQLLERK